MEQPAQCFEDLIVWQKAHQYVLGVYKLTEQFPKHELYGLVSQIRRAAVSVPANIAEGFNKATKPEKARFYNIAQSSLEETRYYLILSRDLGYSQNTELFSQAQEIKKIIESYRKKLVSDK